MRKDLMGSHRNFQIFYSVVFFFFNKTAVFNMGSKGNSHTKATFFKNKFPLKPQCKEVLTMYFSITGKVLTGN